VERIGEHTIQSWPLPERQAGQTLPKTQASQARRINLAAFAPARCQLLVLPCESLPIVVPVHEGRRGHPTLIAWRHVAAIREHPSGKGINDYLRSRREQILEIPAPSAAVLWDLDTPEDYERLRREGGVSQ
jgi:CTP:molybdopterin cytidylyltransferase MocA